MVVNKTDPVVNLSINTPSRSLSKILILAIDPDDRKQFAHTEKSVSYTHLTLPTKA